MVFTSSKIRYILFNNLLLSNGPFGKKLFTPLSGVFAEMNAMGVP
jgi:hypothetical protein